MRLLNINAGWLKQPSLVRGDWEIHVNEPYAGGLAVDLSQPWPDMSKDCPREKRIYVSSEPSWYMNPCKSTLSRLYGRIFSHREDYADLPAWRLCDFAGPWVLEPIPDQPIMGIGGIFTGKNLGGAPGYKQRIRLLDFESQIAQPGMIYSPRGSWHGEKFDYPLPDKIPSMRWMFHLSIENCREANYHSEKILDPMICGRVPVYWGDPKIGNWFNRDGIIILDEQDPAGQINALTEADYHSRRQAIDENQRRALEYVDHVRQLIRLIERDEELTCR